MALHTVSNLKDSVAGLLSGVDLANVDDVNGCLERAASTLCQKADVPEASGVQNITLYDGVTDYLCDTRIFGTAISDIRPQGVSRSPANMVTKASSDDFDRAKTVYYPSGTMSSFEYQNGVPIIKILYPFRKQKIVIDKMSDTTGWTAAGSASLLAQDLGVFYQEPASLRFTLTGASTGTLTKTINSIDLSAYQGVGVGFLAIEIPDGTTASNLTSIECRIGTDSSNYYVTTETTGFLGAWTAGNWVLVAFDALSSVTGTPDPTNITYIQARFTTGATITNFRVGGLWISSPTAAQICYQSSAIFLPSGSASTLTTITADTDTIILNEAAYLIYLYEGANSILQNTGAGASDATSIKNNLILDGNGNTDIGLYAHYRGDNPSQELRQTGSWYDNSQGYGGNYPSNW